MGRDHQEAARMTKVRLPIQGTVTAASSRQRRWLIVSFVVLAGGTLLAVNGAEQNDSGWAIGVPSPFSTSDSTADTRQQIILRHVLDQAQQPLLQKPSPTSAPQAKFDHSHAAARVAARPEFVDGWRAASEANLKKSESSGSTSAYEDGGPHLGLPIAVKQKQTADDFECDCSGTPSHAKSAPIAAPRDVPPSLADAYSNVPELTPADSADEETCQGPAVQGAADQGAANDEADRATADDTTPVETSADDAVASDEAPAEEVPQDLGPALESKIPVKTPPAASSAKEKSTSKPAVKTPAPVKTEAVPPPPLTKQLMMLRSRVRGVLSGYYRKQLNSKENDPWEVMHGMLAYGLQSRIRQGGERGEAITSVGWLCYNKPCKGQTLMYVNPQGEVRAKYGVGLQGHLGQLLAMLAQCHVSADYPIHVGKNEFTVRDLIEAEKKTCYPKSELTFKLIALQHYIDLNDKWVNDQGVDWNMERLIREEMAQPIRGAACGGTHRLSGLSLAVKTRVRRGEPLDGEYAKADEFVKKYQQYAFRLQNRDGSLSTSWFRGAGDDDDINRRIKTTGHILEWLCYSLSDEELRDQRTVRAVTYLANLMYSNYDNEWEIGPRSHATHALLLYDERVFQPFDKEGTVASYRANPAVAKANQPKSSTR